MTSFAIDVATSNDVKDLATFAAQNPLEWNDFASIAQLNPEQPKIWLARDGSTVVAAAIDDGLAMSVGGEPEALKAISEAVDDLPDKLVVAGRTNDVRNFVDRVASDRRERPENFMAVQRGKLLNQPEQIPMRIAEEADLELLVSVRASALGEEYGIDVVPGTKLYTELADAVHRAVGMQGVAIWTEDGQCAFTAQLIAKTAEASMFGDLYVEPALRGAGRATRALTAFCAWLMSESEHVVLRVGKENEPAIRLYDRVGFLTIADFCSSLSNHQPGEAPTDA